MNEDKNIFGDNLKDCSCKPLTGFYRNGKCSTSDQDMGSHTVCVQLTTSFLEFSREQGNDLITPRPEYGFEGLKGGDKWCLCANRWLEAYHQGFAPEVFLESTHEKALEIISMEFLEKKAISAKIFSLAEKRSEQNH